MPSLCVKLTVTLLPPVVCPAGRALPQPDADPAAGVAVGVADAFDAVLTEVVLVVVLVVVLDDEELLNKRAPQIPLLACGA